MAWLLFAAAAAVAMLAYWPGLQGPYIYDDAQHLALVGHWKSGNLKAADVLFFNQNFLINRSLAMASFMFTAWIGGETVFPLKLANLITHVLTGLVAWRVFAALLARDPHLAARAKFFSALLAAVWLLHPLNVSTVLYIVQHMAQIAALCCLIGVGLYAAIRTRMLDGRLSPAQGVLLLFVAVGGMTLIGLQGKQNAIILPGLCLVVELAWFQPLRQWSRGLRLFYVCSVVLPSLAAITLVIWKWPAINQVALGWGMTLHERLLTEPRVLWDYVRMLLVPHSPSMSFFGDDFSLSHSLLKPITTLPAILGLAVITVWVWRVRQRMPSVFAGWLWFLVAHAVEAGPVPVELYYEHRNYLPAFGLFLMLIGLWDAASRYLQARGLRMDRIGAVLVVGILAVLTTQTATRAQVWKTGTGIGMAALDSHPQSIRAHMALANASIEAGRVEDAYHIYEHLSQQEDPLSQAVGRFELITISCMVKHDADPADLAEAFKRLPARMHMVTPYIVGHLVGVRSSPQGCGRITPAMLGEGIERATDRAVEQDDANEAMWPMRLNSALAYYQANELDKALVQARRSWQPRADPGIALLLVTLELHADHPERAEALFDDLLARAGYQRVEQIWTAGARAQGLRKIRQMIDDYKSGKGKPPLEGQSPPPVKAVAPAQTTAPAKH